MQPPFKNPETNPGSTTLIGKLPSPECSKICNFLRANMTQQVETPIPHFMATMQVTDTMQVH